jgi:hypothetical protein
MVGILELIILFAIFLIGVTLMGYAFIYIMKWSDDRTNRFEKIDLD